MSPSPPAHRPARLPLRFAVVVLAACLLGACGQATVTPDANPGPTSASPLPDTGAEPAASVAPAATTEAVPVLPVPNPAPLPTPGGIPIPLPAPAPVTPATADGVHVLAVGEETAIGPGTRLRFERIISDSRCPAGVQCVWAGEVRIAMSVVSPGDTSAFELSGRENRTTVQAFEIELLSYDACPIDTGGPKKECASVKTTAGRN